MDEPTDEDCCHSDCKNCILDIYQQQKSKVLSTVKPLNYTNTVMSQTRYKPFRLVNIEVDTPTTNIYTFEAEEKDEKSHFLFNPGEYVVLRNQPKMSKDSDVHLSRSYTLIPWEFSKHPCRFSAVIKLYSDGEMSNYIRQWNLGAISYWRGPYGDFSYTPKVFKQVVMICMGTGVAPMYSIAKHIIEIEDDAVIKLQYGCRNPDEILLRREINKLSNYWNFHCTYFLSEGYHVNQKKFNENFITGRIQTESLLNLLKDSLQQNLVLICGNDTFNAQFSETLINAGLLESNVHVFS